MVENILNRIRLMINVEGREELLQEVIRLVAMPVLLYIKQEAIPTELEWIVVELAIKRYNRIGAEGFTEEKSDNIQNRYEESMINEYISFLDRWIENNTEVVEVKGVRFF
jgi:hypothetical protein